MGPLVLNPEFHFIKEVSLDLIEMPIWFEIYRNKDEQFLVIMKDETDKSIMFYKDFEELHSVFSNDFSDDELNTWK